MKLKSILLIAALMVSTTTANASPNFDCLRAYAMTLEMVAIQYPDFPIGSAGSCNKEKRMISKQSLKTGNFSLWMRGKIKKTQKNTSALYTYNLSHLDCLMSAEIFDESPRIKKYMTEFKFFCVDERRDIE